MIARIKLWLALRRRKAALTPQPNPEYTRRRREHLSQERLQRAQEAVACIYNPKLAASVDRARAARVAAIKGAV